MYIVAPQCNAAAVRFVFIAHDKRLGFGEAQAFQKHEHSPLLHRDITFD